MVQIPVLPIVLAAYHPSGSIFSGRAGYRFDDRSHDDYRHSVRCRVFSRESRANLDSARPDRIVSGLRTTGFTACFSYRKQESPCVGASAMALWLIISACAFNRFSSKGVGD